MTKTTSKKQKAPLTTIVDPVSDTDYSSSDWEVDITDKKMCFAGQNTLQTQWGTVAP